MVTKAPFPVDPPTDEDLARLQRMARSFAEAGIPGRGLSPMLLALYRGTPRGPLQCDLFSLLVPFNEADEKREALEDQGRTFYCNRLIPVAVCLVTEAWVVRGGPGELPVTEPRHDPRRVEQVIAAGTTIDGKVSFFCARPLQRRANVAAWAGEWVEGKAASFPLLNHFWRGFFFGRE